MTDKLFTLAELGILRAIEAQPNQYAWPFHQATIADLLSKHMIETLPKDPQRVRITDAGRKLLDGCHSDA